MSTLVAQTISNGTISTSTANVINGAKAWVNFNGTGTVAIRASYNVSSITDGGTGIYTVNFTTAMLDANYAVGATAGDILSTSAGQRTFVEISLFTTSSVRILSGFSGAYVDVNGVTVQVFR